MASEDGNYVITEKNNILQEMERIYSIMHGTDDSGNTIILEEYLYDRLDWNMLQSDAMYYKPYIQNMYGFESMTLSEELKNDNELALVLIKYDLSALKIFSADIKNDKEFIKQVLKYNFSILYFFPMNTLIKTLADIEIVKIIITQNGGLLEFVSFAIKDNEDIVNLACASHISAILYASERLINDEEFIFNMFIKNSDVLFYLKLIKSELLYNEQFVDHLINTVPEKTIGILRYVGEDIINLPKYAEYLRTVSVNRMYLVKYETHNKCPLQKEFVIRYRRYIAKKKYNRC